MTDKEVLVERLIKNLLKLDIKHWRYDYEKDYVYLKNINIILSFDYVLIDEARYIVPDNLSVRVKILLDNVEEITKIEKLKYANELIVEKLDASEVVIDIKDILSIDKEDNE